VREIQDNGEKAWALQELARTLVQTGHTDQVLQFWGDAFILARLLGREPILKMLQHSASALATLDQGRTLWQVSEAVMEVEGWWSGRIKVEG
jgi:hypothetical protein